MSLEVLIIDDESMFREDLATLLTSEGLTCATAASGEEGLQIASERQPQIVLTDLSMPGIDGLEVVRRLAGESPDSTVIVITAFASLESAVEAFRGGAADYVLKPVVPDDLLAKIQRIREADRKERELLYLRRALSEADTGLEIIGKSAAIQEVRELIAKVGPAPSSVLVLGATGSGKELVARALHAVRCGDQAPLVAVNCAALPRELIESELFGHVKGAFTGAARDKAGVFEIAGNGTLFLDEICEMPVDLQPKLLRALEEQKVTRVGGSRPISTPARIVAATNRDVDREVAEGRLRQDLLFRIGVVEISLPPLGERREDIPLLVDHLLVRLSQRLKRAVPLVDARAMRMLMAAEWPGNVRELENVLERAMLLGDGERLRAEDLPWQAASAPEFRHESQDLRAAVRAYEAHHIRQVLTATEGNREEAARRLGIDPSTLYRRLKDLDG